MQILVAHLRRKHIRKLRKYLPHRNIRRRQRKLAALNLGDIQNIINQRQQALSGTHGLVQALRHIFRILHMMPGNGHHAKNCVHRGADVVGHRGKKLRLRLAGLLCKLCRPAETEIHMMQVKSVHCHKHYDRAANEKYDHPGTVVWLQFRQLYHAKDIQIGMSAKGGIKPQTVFPAEIFVIKRSAFRGLQCFLQKLSLVKIILKVISADVFRKREGLHGGRLDHIISPLRHNTNLSRLILCRKHPGFFNTSAGIARSIR